MKDDGDTVHVEEKHEESKAISVDAGRHEL